MNTSRIGFLALLSIASLAGGGCATLAESESAARELVAKKSAESNSPSALVTRYSGALESFGDMLEKYRPSGNCLLYTSDAADERSSVDLGGRRILKQKKERKKISFIDHQ